MQLRGTLLRYALVGDIASGRDDELDFIVVVEDRRDRLIVEASAVLAHVRVAALRLDDISETLETRYFLRQDLGELLTNELVSRAIEQARTRAADNTRRSSRS